MFIWLPLQPFTSSRCPLIKEWWSESTDKNLFHTLHSIQSSKTVLRQVVLNLSRLKPAQSRSSHRRADFSAYPFPSSQTTSRIWFILSSTGFVCIVLPYIFERILLAGYIDRCASSFLQFSRWWLFRRLRCNLSGWSAADLIFCFLQNTGGIAISSLSSHHKISSFLALFEKKSKRSKRQKPPASAEELLLRQQMSVSATMQKMHSASLGP